MIVNAANSRRCLAAVASTAPSTAPPAPELLRRVPQRLGGCATGRRQASPAWPPTCRARHVIHTVGPVWRGGDGRRGRRCSPAATGSSMDAGGTAARPASIGGLSGRSPPAVYGFPPERAAPIAVATVGGSTLDRTRRRTVRSDLLLLRGPPRASCTSVALRGASRLDDAADPRRGRLGDHQLSRGQPRRRRRLGSWRAGRPIEAGIHRQVADGQRFEAVLDERARSGSGAPVEHARVLASGMITSRQGWVEVALCPLPGRRLTEIARRRESPARRRAGRRGPASSPASACEDERQSLTT